MTKERKKITTKMVQDLYLYPYGTMGENVIHGLVWIASWLIGVVGQQSQGTQALGGAYFILAASLLLEFSQPVRTYRLANIIHSIFCTLLFLMLISAFLLITWNVPAEEAAASWIYCLLDILLPCFGWIIFAMIILSTLLALVQAHKYCFDEDAEAQRKIAAIRQEALNYFQECLKGPPKGGEP